MVEKGWLTPQERDAVSFEDVLKSLKTYKPKQLSGTSGYAVDLIKAELRDKYQLTDSDIQRGGCGSSRRSTRAGRRRPSTR